MISTSSSANWEFGDGIGYAKSRHFRPNLAFFGSLVQMPEWLAGDAVLIAPVSKQIPWYQGILQGILRFCGLETRFGIKKPLRCSQFWRNSLRRLTAKIFWGTANFKTVSGIYNSRNRASVSMSNCSPNSRRPGSLERPLCAISGPSRESAFGCTFRTWRDV